MLNKDMLNAILAQVTIEEESARVYYQMGQVAKYLSWDGFACWYCKQGDEEVDHANKFKDYLNLHGHLVILDTIAKPDLVPTSNLEGAPTLLELATVSLKHEEFVTSQLQKIAEGALALQDFATMDLLQWYLKEQVEEEDKFARLITKLKYAGDNMAALFELDEEYGGD